MRNNRRRHAALGPSFWGPPAGETPPAGGTVSIGGIRPTDTPDAVVRSLGTPPLAHNDYDTRRHFRAVCEEAVRAATALAAANGLLVDDDQDA
jgi:hypothetical protein